MLNFSIRSRLLLKIYSCHRCQDKHAHVPYSIRVHYYSKKNDYLKISDKVRISRFEGSVFLQQISKRAFDYRKIFMGERFVCCLMGYRILRLLIFTVAI